MNANEEILDVLETVSEEIENIDSDRFYMEEARADLASHLANDGDIEDDLGKECIRKLRRYFDRMNQTLAGLDVQLSHLPEWDDL